MFTKVSILMAIVLVFSASEVQADVIHSRWVGGEDGGWGNANNWEPHIVPDNTAFQTFVVTIDSNTVDDNEIEIGFAGGNEYYHGWRVDEIRCYGKVELDNWTPLWRELNINNGFTNYGELLVDAVDFNASILNASGARIRSKGVDLEVTDFLTNMSNAEVIVDGKLDVDDGGISNEGLITVLPHSRIEAETGLLNRGTLTLTNAECYVHSVINNESNGVVTGFGVISANQLLQNKGQIIASGGSFAIKCDGTLTNTATLGNKPLSSLHIKPAEDVNNFGTIEVNAGGGVAFDCNLVNESGAKIKLLGGNLAAQTITQSADANFRGFGSITGDVIIEPDGIIKLTGPTNIVGNVTIEHNAVLEISDGQTLITGHTTNNGIIRVVNGNVVFQGGYSGSGLVQKN